MDFKQLEAYVKVYELKSFSKAAEAIFISQPSISAYVSSLENELDIRLINRSTKEVYPTAAGKVFYEYAKNMLNLKKKSELSLKRLTDCTAGEVEIIASSVPAQYILPEILAKFHKTYPNIFFRLKQADTAEVIKEISEQRSELGFTGARIENSKCSFEYLMPDKLIIIAPHGMENKYSSLEDLFYSESFIMREAGSGTRMVYEEFFKNAGIKINSLKVSAYLNNTQSIINAVSCGLGISIVSELAAKYYLTQNMISRIDIGYPLPQRDFYLVSKKNMELMPVAKVFINFAKEFVARSGGTKSENEFG